MLLLLLPRKFPGQCQSRALVKETASAKQSCMSLSLAAHMRLDTFDTSSACVLEMTCRRSSQLSTEERESAWSRQRQPSANHNRPKHPTRTCEDSDMTYVLLRREKAIAIEGSYRDIIGAYLLQRPLPASHDRSSLQPASRHTPSSLPQRAQQQALRNQTPPAQSQSGSQELFLLSIARPCLRVSARREARQTVLPWCRRKTPPLGRDISQTCKPALRVHPMWHVKLKQGLCVYFVRHQIRPSNQSVSHRKQPGRASHLFRKASRVRYSTQGSVDEDPQEFFSLNLADMESPCPKTRSADSLVRISPTGRASVSSTCLGGRSPLQSKSPIFLHRSSAKEAHIPRRLHPNTKQRRNDTGPPKPSFLLSLPETSASDPWYKSCSRGFEGARWHVPKPHPQLARESTVYTPAFPKRLCSHVKKAQRLWRSDTYHVSLVKRGLGSALGVGLRRIIHWVR
jgi:hypothetical protein